MNQQRTAILKQTEQRTGQRTEANDLHRRHSKGLCHGHRYVQTSQYRFMSQYRSIPWPQICTDKEPRTLPDVGTVRGSEAQADVTADLSSHNVRCHPHDGDNGDDNDDGDTQLRLSL